jgi:hypothetical protein
VSRPGPANQRRGPTPEPPRRLDRGVRWSLGLLLAFFPLMLLFLAVIAAVGSMTGVEFGSGEDVAAERRLNTIYVIVALSPLAASIAIASRTWLRRRQQAALVIAILAVLSAVAFLVFPAIAGAG